jgi:CubicO group peptidase (beta-lactamase class C family)
MGVPGLSAVLVREGAIVSTSVAGVANVNDNKPVTQDTVFTWASVSKIVTATALMQFFDEGKFGLDDDVGAYIGFPIRVPSCPKAPVTFRQLLTHTSAIRDSKLYDSLYVDGDSPIPLGEFIRAYLAPGGRYYDPKRNFRSHCPGTVYEYSNIGAGVIGYLVEMLSGLPFERYVTDRIFGPLGMINTSFRLTDLDISMIALPGGTGPLQGFPTFPDGTLRSSPSNLAKLLIAYMQEGCYRGRQILKPATVHGMLSNQTRLDSSQGLIWHTQKFDNIIMWGHAGDDPGISSNMFFDPLSKTGILLVANGEWKHDARRTMRRLLSEASRITDPDGRQRA